MKVSFPHLHLCRSFTEWEEWKFKVFSMNQKVLSVWRAFVTSRRTKIANFHSRSVEVTGNLVFWHNKVWKCEKIKCYRWKHVVHEFANFLTVEKRLKRNKNEKFLFVSHVVALQVEQQPTRVSFLSCCIYKCAAEFIFRSKLKQTIALSKLHLMDCLLISWGFCLNKEDEKPFLRFHFLESRKTLKVCLKKLCRIEAAKIQDFFLCRLFRLHLIIMQVSIASLWEWER